MRAVSTRDKSVGVLIGVGAGLAIVALLVIQAVSSGGAFGTRTETVTETSTVTSSLQSVTQSSQTVASVPCPANPVPGESEVISNGVQICVVGPLLVVNPDGQVDFRNGTVVNLHANLTGAATLGEGGSGGRNDTVILTNGTRITFDSQGVVVTISPYQGRAVYSNGTITSFPVCQYPITSVLAGTSPAYRQMERPGGLIRMALR